LRAAGHGRPDFETDTQDAETNWNGRLQSTGQPMLAARNTGQPTLAACSGKSVVNAAGPREKLQTAGGAVFSTTCPHGRSVKVSL
jgi:hypothetical protein